MSTLLRQRNFKVSKFEKKFKKEWKLPKTLLQTLIDETELTNKNFFTQ